MEIILPILDIQVVRFADLPDNGQAQSGGLHSHIDAKIHK